MSSEVPIRTLHLLTSLNRRGAETFAIQLVERLSRDRFLPAIWTVSPPGPLGGQYLTPQATAVLSRAAARREPGMVATLAHLVGVLRAWKPHIVQCHGGRALKYGMLAKPFHRRCAYVYTKIGSVHPWLDPLHKRLLYGYLFEQLDAIIAVGEQVMEEVEASFHPRRPRLLTIHTGRDVTTFAEITPEMAAEKRAELGMDKDDLCLMSVGSLSWEKNPQALLRVLAAVLPQVPRARLVYVGGGPLAGDLRKQADREGVADKVRFTGVRHDVPALLHAADVFLLPSLTEGLPGVLIEAGMAGLPAVATRVGSVQNILRDGETGFVVPVRDEQAFVAMTLRLLGDQQLRQRLGGQAMEFCRRDFDIRRSVQRHESLFLELVNGPRSHAPRARH
jgi:glycosyltransferase involved in cell wall biosynthesis